MTDDQKYLIEMLLDNKHYLIETTNHKGRNAWKLMNGVSNPVRYIRKGPMKRIKALLKKDKHHRHTLNLSLVRKLNGHNYIKKLYVKSKTKPVPVEYY